MTRLRTLGLVLVGLLLVLPLAPAGAWFGSDEPARSADPDRPATWGRTSAPDQVLRSGCRRYAYRYWVTPPTDEWAAEIFLFNPRGKKVGSAYYLTPQDPDRGSRRWTLCTTSTGPGRYTIKMRVTYQRFGQNQTGWARSSTFRMTRP